MNISDFAKWITDNSFWIFGIIIFGFLGYKLVEAYFNNKEKIDRFINKFKKNKKEE